MEFDVSLFWSPLILQALWTTVWVSVLSHVLATVLSIPVGLAETSRIAPLRAIAWLYNWIFQGTPLLLQLIFFYAVLPLLGLTLPVAVAGIVGLTLHETARMSQVVRASLLGVDRSQIDAAKVLGLGRASIAWHITAPQAIRLAIPPLGNELNYILKASSQLAAISIVELTRQTQIFTDTDLVNPVQYYVVAAVYYLVLSFAWKAVQVRLERTPARRGPAPARVDGLPASDTADAVAETTAHENGARA
jgi:polar amino acid transport system permease protein